MTEYRTVLEQTRDRFPAPDLPLERVLRRRDRRRRNQRVAAGAVGIAIAIFAVLVGTSLIRSSDRPGDGPPGAPSMHNGPIEVFGFTGGVRVLNAQGLGRFAVECGEGCTEVDGADWSPDGTLLAFSPSCGGGCATAGDPYHGIRVVDPANGTDRLIVAGEFLGRLSWSPDGTRIAYMTAGRTGRQVWVVDVDGSSPTLVATGLDEALPYAAPSWSPDGSHLLVADGASLVQVAVDGSGPTPFATGSVAAWSPDGTTIAYLSGCDLHLTAPDGGDDRSLVDLSGTGPDDERFSCEDPLDLAWSPDDTRLVALLEGGVSDPDRPSQQAAFEIRVSDGSADRIWGWSGDNTFWGITWQPVP